MNAFLALKHIGVFVLESNDLLLLVVCREWQRTSLYCVGHIVRHWHCVRLTLNEMTKQHTMILPMTRHMGPIRTLLKIWPLSNPTVYALLSITQCRFDCRKTPMMMKCNMTMQHLMLVLMRCTARSTTSATEDKDGRLTIDDIMRKCKQNGWHCNIVQMLSMI
jgi:hypothetical protein